MYALYVCKIVFWKHSIKTISKKYKKNQEPVRGVSIKEKSGELARGLGEKL